ncbi:hypothetical protein OG589_10985 [Sphaerisporangium sp. NBC_01403]|uniref:hypothetical protein n=1 Tax=Sphaerisporangium sp. NBC_01403 TaxID=2903599 RepID=UPI0032473131
MYWLSLVPGAREASLVYGVPPQLVAFVELEMARVETLSGNPDGAREPLRRALRLIARTEDDTARATVLEGVAEWRLAVGQAERAATALGAASSLRGMEERGSQRVVDTSPRLHTGGKALAPVAKRSHRPLHGPGR